MDKKVIERIISKDIISDEEVGFLITQYIREMMGTGQVIKMTCDIKVTPDNYQKVILAIILYFDTNIILLSF